MLRTCSSRGHVKVASVGGPSAGGSAHDRAGGAEIRKGRSIPSAREWRLFWEGRLYREFGLGRKTRTPVGFYDIWAALEPGYPPCKGGAGGGARVERSENGARAKALRGIETPQRDPPRPPCGRENDQRRRRSLRIANREHRPNRIVAQVADTRLDDWTYKRRRSRRNKASIPSADRSSGGCPDWRRLYAHPPGKCPRTA